MEYTQNPTLRNDGKTNWPVVLGSLGLVAAMTCFLAANGPSVHLDAGTVYSAVSAEQLVAHPDQYQGERVRLTCTLDMLGENSALGACGKGFATKLAAAHRLPPLTQDDIWHNLNGVNVKVGPEEAAEDLFRDDKATLTLTGNSFAGYHNQQTVLITGIVGKAYSSEIPGNDGNTSNDIVPLEVDGVTPASAR